MNASGKETGCIAVVGGINMDIGGRPYGRLTAKDSNPGRVRISVGGVGRNIAHNLSLLGLKVSFLTAFGDDAYADRIEAGCAEAGIDIRHARKVPGARTSCYLFVSDEQGDMAVAVSDMEICREISPEYLEAQLPVLNAAEAVVLDANLSPEALVFLAERCTVPLFADPVSASKAERVKPILGRLHTLKPNRLEAELLSGIPITDEGSLRKAADALLKTGLKRVFLSLGGEGVFVSDGRESFRVPAVPAEVRNTTGAGDAFMAALVRAWIDGMDLRSTAAFACAAAAVASESEETVNPALSYELVRSRSGV